MMSNELDILIVGDRDERFTTEARLAFRHWQVYSVTAPLRLYGRQARVAYYTEGAETMNGWRTVQEHLRAGNVELRPWATYKPDVIDAASYKDTAMLRDIRRSRHTAN